MINTNHRCDKCNGTVKNIDGKRHSPEQLQKIHDETCPGLFRGSKK